MDPSAHKLTFRPESRLAAGIIRRGSAEPAHYRLGRSWHRSMKLPAWR
jgi:hypothetical protein